MGQDKAEERRHTVCTKMTMSWNANDLRRETINHAVKDKVSVYAINDIANIVKNAIMLDTVVSMPTSKSKMKNTAFMHSFYCAYKYGESTYLLKLYAEQSLSKNGDTVFSRVYQLKDIKKVATISNGVSDGKPSLSDDTVATINTVSDLYRYVKSFDKDFMASDDNAVLHQ